MLTNDSIFNKMLPNMTLVLESVSILWHCLRQIFNIFSYCKPLQINKKNFFHKKSNCLFLFLIRFHPSVAEHAAHVACWGVLLQKWKQIAARQNANNNNSSCSKRLGLHFSVRMLMPVHAFHLSVRTCFIALHPTPPPPAPSIHPSLYLYTSPHKASLLLLLLLLHLFLSWQITFESPDVWLGSGSGGCQGAYLWVPGTAE